MKHHNVYDPRRIFGVTTLDVVRASTFISQIKSNVDASSLRVTVVGGHSGATIVPLISQTGHSFTEEELKALTNRIQFGGDEVVKAKDGAGSATLSMAYAGARFANAIIDAMTGVKGIIEPMYVKSDLYASQGVGYFSSNVELGVRPLPVICFPYDFSPKECTRFTVLGPLPRTRKSCSRLR